MGTAPVFKPRTVEFYRGGKDNFTAFPYDKLIWVNFWKSRGVIVHFASHTIHIAGSDIVAVYEGLRDQTLKSVGPAEDPVGPRTPGVEAVYIKQVGKNDPGFTWPEIEKLEGDDA